jgi:hypothetical protein
LIFSWFSLILSLKFSSSRLFRCSSSYNRREKTDQTAEIAMDLGVRVSADSYLEDADLVVEEARGPDDVVRGHGG